MSSCHWVHMLFESADRVMIEGVSPEVDGGRFPIKRVLGEDVVVEANIFTDGHQSISAVLRHRQSSQRKWIEVPMEPLANDRWRASFSVDKLGTYVYTLAAWIDPFKGWRQDLAKRVEAGQDIAVDLLIGADLVEQAVERASAKDAGLMRTWVKELRDEALDQTQRADLALGEDVAAIVNRCADPARIAPYSRELQVAVDPVRARYSAWYELFPRSMSQEPGAHGTFRDCERLLPEIAEMGFDVLYLPPIHPIGETFRKGKNNSLTPEGDDVGSPWAIGAKSGGHTEIHPHLGKLDDFRRFVDRARDFDIEVALDIAFQCSPDHPWVLEHPEWFTQRPDGTIQYAENPPKKYQDIYPLNFETSDPEGLWTGLKGVFDYWIAQGVRIFRVDNPHTKPFPFWEWVIGEIKGDHPETIFLAEAFTRPNPMYRLAKLGFTQSYTYFAWRNTKWELTEYFTELATSGVREFFRPNLWPNTPDILTEYLQLGGRPAFMARLVLAATLGASYGIYGPAYEMCENDPREPGSEEYLDSEKYQIRQRKLGGPETLRPLITRVNKIRRENPALHADDSLLFHETDNPDLICFSKTSTDGKNVVVAVVNLNPHFAHSGWVTLDMAKLGLEETQPYQMHDLISDARYLWSGPRNFVSLDPQSMPAHVFRIRRRTRHEQDFEYFA